MLRFLRPAVVMIVALTLIAGLAYPLATTGLARLLFPGQAAGSLVVRQGRVVGSALIGQAFASARYFHTRPSATVGAPDDASSSGGSNLAPTARALTERVAGEVASLHAENPGAPIPADLATTSASGLDPDLSPAAAAFQVARVARARGLAPARVQALVEAHTEGRLFGLIGEPRVNVLALNLALDGLK